MSEYTAIVQQSGDWWIGWIEEIPGVNSQGKTRAELKKNLRSALTEALEFNRQDARNCEWQQKGVRSREFRHGVYMPQEFDCDRFARWVRTGLRRARA